MRKINLKKLKHIYSKVDFLFCFSPVCSWVFLIIFFLVLDLIILVGGSFFYLKIEKDGFFVKDVDVEETSHLEKIKKRELMEVVDLFEKRKEEFVRLKEESFTSLADPSI